MKRFKVLGFHRESCYAQGKFRKKYEEDEIVAAVPGTLGIMVFKSLEEAKAFRIPRAHKCFQIVTVEPIGRGKTPKRIAGVSEYSIKRFYMKDSREYRDLVPKGTICYPAVMVLE